jgi:hypothetical protein
VLRARAAWPWAVTLRLLTSRLQALCARRDLDLADCDAYTKERLWSAGADLMGLASRRYTPLRAQDVHQALRQHLYGRPGSPPVRSTLGRRFSARQAEMIRLEEELGSGRWADADGLLHHPYAIPDQKQGPNVHWVWDGYSPEQLRLRTEQILTAAVEIYTALVDTWFPRLERSPRRPPRTTLPRGALQVVPTTVGQPGSRVPESGRRHGAGCAAPACCPRDWHRP